MYKVMRVLIVEDSVKIAQALKRALELQSFAVDIVHNGDDGLAFALDEPYDLIILDHLLPGSIDGLGICRKLREQNINTPVLMLTAKDKVADRVQGLEAGADDYLVKPFALQEVFARVRALLRRPQHLLPDELRVADLVLNVRALSVQRKGTPIGLSQKEFGLLEYLMRNAGQTLSKDMIMQHVWNYDADILPNTVEACIRRLRAKVDQAFPDEKPLITTVYGFGYRIGP